MTTLNVYEARHLGRDYCCKTEGSDHYKEGGIEPIDLMIAKGVIEDFCIGNMIKYATRFKKTRNLADLKKVSDYAHILCGVELSKQGTGSAVAVAKDTPMVWTRQDANKRYETLCKQIRCSECPIGKHRAEEAMTYCETWCAAHPIKARKIISEVKV